MIEIISVPKTSCFSLNQYLIDHYPEHFHRTDYDVLPGWHATRACESESPMLTIRNPYERFLSSYNYYLNGSEVFKIEEKPSINVFDFLEKAKNINRFFMDASRKSRDKAILMSKDIDDADWKLWVCSISQSYYIEEQDYSRSIVLIYDRNMNEILRKLLFSLRVPLKKVPPLRKANVTRYSKFFLNQREKKAVEEVYKEDFSLYEKAKKQQELFKLVISAEKRAWISHKNIV